ncbi:MAG TPA: acetate/propionate family kinase [Acetobacteraceae bacterium]|nr:acetate/propionate family kinase [Acetobacteraceae bacterium]
MTDAVLTLNAGSSSLKFALYERQNKDDLVLSLHGQIEGVGTEPHLIARDPAGAVLAEHRWDDGSARTHETFLTWLLDWIRDHLGGDKLVAAGHRVVHGGPIYDAPVRITPAVIETLEKLVPLAPLHEPHHIAAIRAVASVRPDLPQVACFDTAFHHGNPPVVSRLALPATLRQEGVRRYGFHGLSYEYIARRLREVAPKLAAGRVIVAHLGAGASLCALRDGRSFDSTMGFTALDGLIMGTRCGALDPGVVLYLMQYHGMESAQIESLLYHESGLLGLGGSSDMRTLLASTETEAIEAVESFTFSIARWTGALASTIGGIDGFVFTAGIGENSAPVRSHVAKRLAWLGVLLDETANQTGSGRISAPGSAVDVWVIPTDEEAMIARHVLEVLVPATAESRA